MQTFSFEILIRYLWAILRRLCRSKINLKQFPLRGMTRRIATEITKQGGVWSPNVVGVFATGLHIERTPTSVRIPFENFLFSENAQKDEHWQGVAHLLK